MRPAQVVTPRLLFQALQSLINRPGLKTLPAAIHYGRSAIDQMKIYNFEMYFRVDADFQVPFAAWRAAVAVVKSLMVERGRCAVVYAHSCMRLLYPLEASFCVLVGCTDDMMPACDAGTSLRHHKKASGCSMRLWCAWAQQCTKHCDGGAVHVAKLGADEPSIL